MAYDLVIIGSGPGGYTAAFRAGQYGLKTALIEKSPKLGGTCLHVGCIPTKALLHTAEVWHNVRNGAGQGILCENPHLDFVKVNEHKNGIVTRHAKGLEALVKKNKVDWIKGAAKLKGAGKVEVVSNGGTQTLEARKIILATGSEARMLPGLAPDPERILTNIEILELKSVPRTLGVIGAGAVGVEFASMFNRFGTKVTLFEMLPRIVPVEDEDISRELERVFKKQGIRVETGARVENVGGRPMIAPFLGGPSGIERLRPPGIDSGIVPEVVRTLRYFLENTPGDVAVVTPPELDPFDAALLMYGSGLFTLMNDEPALVGRLLELITDAFIRVQSHFKLLLEEPPREKVNYLGIAMPGIRVAADALVNLSPAAIARFCYPVFEKLAAAFGGVLVHYCPSPALRYYHVLKPVLECPHVLGVCTSGGVDYFDDPRNPARMFEGKTLIAECDLRLRGGEAAPSASSNVNRFRLRCAAEIPEWLRTGFMRLSLRGRRGLILRTAVSSVEEGRELYRVWRRAMEEAVPECVESFA